jgi:hypothetical protein
MRIEGGGRDESDVMLWPCSRALGLDSGLIDDTPTARLPPSEPLDCIVFYFNERLFSYTAQGKATNKLGYEKKYK